VAQVAGRFAREYRHGTGVIRVFHFSQGDAEMAIRRHGFELRRFTGVVTRAMLVLLVGIFGAGAASATSVNCTGALTGTFDSIIVPAGAECDLGAATVNGSINVRAGGALNMYGPATVKGSVSGNGSAYIAIYNVSVIPTAGTNKNAPVSGKSEVVASNNVLGNLNITNNATAYICGAFIGGNVYITGSFGTEVAFGGSEPDAACLNNGGGNVIGGTVSIQNNNTTFFWDADNVVGRGMTVSGNQGSATKNVLNNSVAGTLACFNNSAPFNASGNSATTSTGQCANKEQGGGG
jgi:hypothetical protein